MGRKVEMEHRYPLNPVTASVMAMYHLSAVVAVFYATPGRILLGFTVWAVVSSFGIGVCYHRLLTHRGFKTYKWVEYSLAVIASLARQGIALFWVAIHRVHHYYTEKEGFDPHTPRDGRWWSHMDWILHPDPRLKDKTYLLKWVPDLVKQPFYRKRYIEWLPSVVLGGTCFLVGTIFWGPFSGLMAVFWGVALPVTVGWHQTWLVNSATHIWGRQRFATGDDSKNSWWVALLTWGEGWHNNHHHRPVNYRHGIKWYEIDVNFYIIKFFMFVRIFWPNNTARVD